MRTLFLLIMLALTPVMAMAMEPAPENQPPHYNNGQEAEPGFIPGHSGGAGENNPVDTPEMATPTCRTYPEWTGMNIADVDKSVLEDRVYRVLKPGSMMTMDYLADRLNIHTDDNGIILKQDCG